MMEGMGALAIVVGVAGLTVALVAIGSASASRRQLEQISRELFELRRWFANHPHPPLAPPLATALPPPPPPTLPPPPPPDDVVPAVAALARALATLGDAPLVDPPLPAAQPASAGLRREAAVAPPLPPVAAAISVPPPAASFEERVALVWFTRIGALILLLGVGFFLQYAADSGWLGPTARLLLGGLAGVAVITATELGRARTQPVFLDVLTGVGLGVLYLVSWASHVLYGVTAAPIAFAGFAVITLVGGLLAVRRRAELVLVFSLIGGFLAPVLLSRGADQPLALFAYLVALTALAFAAAVRFRFVVATWVAVGGTVALTIGWFATRYHPSPTGAYADLASRWPAMLGVAAIAVEWFLVSRAARRRDTDGEPGGVTGDLARGTPVALLLAAVLFAHGGAALLLRDHPPLLAAVTTLLAGLGAAAILADARRELLAVPLAASALVLSIADRSAGWAVAETLTGSAAAMLVYVVAVLRGEWSDGRRPRVASLLVVGGASSAFAALAGLALLADRPHAFALVLVGLSLGQVALAIAAARPAVALAAAGAGLLGLGLVCARLAGGGAGFVVITAGWAGLYLVAGSWELVARRVRPDLLRVATLTTAMLGLVLLAWPAIEQARGRALLPAIDGALLLGLGAILAARKARVAGTILLGQGVALLALAVGVQFAGATTVIVWAVMAAAIVAIAAAAEDDWWLDGGVALFGLTLVLLLPRELQVDGSWRMRFLFNPRAAALAGTAIALLVASAAAARPRCGWFPTARIVLAVAGQALVLALLVTETGDLIADPDRRQVAVTLVLGLHAAALIGLGFGARSSLHRYLGLGLLAATLAKLALVDVWTLRRVYQTVVFLGVGALLVTAGFLYARFGRRLLAILRDGDVRRAG